MVVVYGVKRLSDGRIVYIGITLKDAEQRWDRHQRLAECGSNTKLHRAIRKYGAGAFMVKELHRVGGWRTACKYERELIREYGTFWEQGGYNLTRGGDGTNGFKMPIEDVERRAGNHRGYSHTEKAKQRISRANKGKALRGTGWYHSEDTKQKMRDSALGRELTPEQIAKRTETRRKRGGYNVSEEHRRKLSETSTGRTHTEDARKRIAAAAKGNTRPCKRIRVHDIEYSSRGAALEALGISATKLYRMIRDGEAEYVRKDAPT